MNDKVLHLATFFVLTAVFYWVVDTGRRRALHLALAVCTLAGGVGSEFLQAAIPGNGRDFDPADIAANVAGSLGALALCAWYHRRMLERRRLAARAARYDAVPGEHDDDLELGESVGLTSDIGGQEEGVITGGGGGGRATSTLEDEVDNWDENGIDSWDEEEGNDVGKSNGSGNGNTKTKTKTKTNTNTNTNVKGMDESDLNGPGPAEVKKRVD